MGTLRNLARVTNQFLASFGVFGSFFIIETSQEWGKILWNPWQCKLKLKYMKNQSFGALHSPLPSLAIDFQANQRCKEKKQRNKSNNQHFRMAMRKFRIACEIKRKNSCRTESRTEWKTISQCCAKFHTPCETTWGNKRISHTMRNLLMHRLC